MQKIKHNKVRNTGLLFEFLLRQITSDVLNKKDSKAVKIIKQKFNENTELGKELALYSILFNTSDVICLSKNSNNKPVLRILLCFTLRIVESPFLDTIYVIIHI